MKIFLHEITEQEKELSFSENESWVAQAVLRVDEHTGEYTSEHKSKKPPQRPVQVNFSIRKVDEVIVVGGKIQTHIELMCSRCANTLQYPCNLHFSALFCKDPVMAGVAYLQRQGQDSKENGRPVAQNHGFARHAHDTSNDDDDSSSPSETKDLDITYLSHDFIDLGDVLTEQLQLQIPFQPLCQESCKGICSQCGTDLNHGRCACARIEKRRPFSVLSDFKI